MDYFVSDQDMAKGNRVQRPLVAGQDETTVQATVQTAVQGLRLLIVEDDVALAESLRGGLAGHGFLPTVAHSAKAAWETLDAATFDLILLDVGLPEGSDAGFELARRVREVGFGQPILFLSSRQALTDRVRGLKLGDDYLTKPYEPLELVARLEALSRRGPLPPRVIRWREVEFFLEGRKVYRNGRLIGLTAKEYEILELLMLNPGQAISRDEILERVWGANHIAQSNIVDVYIKNIRTKVDKAIVETVRGLGYRFGG